MSQFPSEDLTRFASLPPASRAAALLRALTELFTVNDKNRAEDAEVFEELFLSVYQDAPWADRMAVADQLVNRADLPVPIAVVIGLDRVEVAQRFLPRSPVLGPLDLVRIAVRRGMSHRRLIATRQDLDPSVVAMLLETFEPDVVRLLLDNPSVSLDEDTIKRLRRRAADEASDLRRALKREPKQPAIPAEAFVALNADDRAAAINAAMKTAALRAVEAPGRQPKRAISAVELGALLIERAFAKDFGGIARLLAVALEVTPAAGRGVFEDAGGEPLAIALAALGIDDKTATSLLILSDRNGARGYFKTRDLVSLYESLGWRAAQSIVEAWRAEGRVFSPLRRSEEKRAVSRSRVPSEAQRPIDAPASRPAGGLSDLGRPEARPVASRPEAARGMRAGEGAPRRTFASSAPRRD